MFPDDENPYIRAMKYTYTASALPNTRIDVADILRGIAIAGIVLLHFIEHLNFYAFPEPTRLDQAVWDSAFFIFGGKMYAIFALLFGLSFFIQNDNQAKKGVDFRPRFLWRMLLLLIWGLFDLCFYNGDILSVYAVCALFVVPFIRSRNSVLIAIAAVMFIQPVELVCIIRGLANPDAAPLGFSGSGAHYAAMYEACAEGSFLQVAEAGIVHGFISNFQWAIANGRLTQTVCLFTIGILLGRRRLFYDEGDNLRIWKRILLGSLVMFCLVNPWNGGWAKNVGNEGIANALSAMQTMWRNFSMMWIIVSGVCLLYYRTRARKVLAVLAPYGKMSLTNYLGQSMIGSLLFYNWGFGLYAVSGHTMSICIGLAVVILQIGFSHLWLRHHKRGPFETVWNRLTWIGGKR